MEKLVACSASHLILAASWLAVISAASRLRNRFAVALVPIAIAVVGSCCATLPFLRAYALSHDVELDGIGHGPFVQIVTWGLTLPYNWWLRVGLVSLFAGLGARSESSGGLPRGRLIVGALVLVSLCFGWQNCLIGLVIAAYVWMESTAAAAHAANPRGVGKSNGVDEAGDGSGAAATGSASPRSSDHAASPGDGAVAAPPVSVDLSSQPPEMATLHSRMEKSATPAAVESATRPVDHDTPIAPEIEALARDFRRIRDSISGQLFGMDDVVHLTLVSLLAGGHVLFEGNPGLGKTMLVTTLARALGVVFKRGQFTPDLLPSDITGDRILDQQTNEFRFQPGPLFAHLFLADEVNRAPAKTQAALLEAMQELQVTAAGERYSLGEREPRPPDAAALTKSSASVIDKLFFVLATQNPLEQEGTYALPEAQLDRFLMRLFFGYPTHSTILRILEATLAEDGQADRRTEGLGFDRVIRHRLALRRHVVIDQDVREFIAAVIEATHTHPQCACGASPRAAQALLLCSVARAAMDGRSRVGRDDVAGLAFAILNHRILLTQEAMYDAGEKDQVALLEGVIRDILTKAAMSPGLR